MSDKALIAEMVRCINASVEQEIRIMEICGTHTYAIARYGIRDLLSPKIALLSGPGCPVCVTPQSYIDGAIDLAVEDCIIVTFGDLMKVSGTASSLQEERARGKKVIIACSPLDSIGVARENPDKQVVFLAVGFETTAPLIALAVQAAEANNIDNLSFFVALKLINPVLRKILETREKKLDGIICPGHVAAVKGADYFAFITSSYGVSAVISGFEALDIISGIYFLTQQTFVPGKPMFANQYRRFVGNFGNERANKVIEETFNVGSSEWRGIGEIASSALLLKEKYQTYDAARKFKLVSKKTTDNQKCECSDIILGNKLPGECSFFASACTPQTSLGPCMVSSEGSCAAYYRYRRGAEGIGW